MHWTEQAIILSTRPQGETSLVVRAFALKHGIYSAMAKGARSKRNRGIIQPGNIVSLTWNARLPEHLGIFTAELLEPVAAYMMPHADRLAALTSACMLLELGLPERHPYDRLFHSLLSLIHALKSDTPWQQDYVRFELDILAESGFGLDLSSCAATGQRDELIYVSPKSGRAVSRDAGKPYHGKLLPLPHFLLPTPRHLRNDYHQETQEGMLLTGYFLEHWLLKPHGRHLPAARHRLLDIMKQTANEFI